MKIPRLNIIHLPNDNLNFPHRQLREQSFLRQTDEQKIEDFWVWDGIYNQHDPKKGICMAHKQIIQDAKEKKLPNCLIMEDDAVFSAPGAFDYFISRIPEDYDIFMGMIYVGDIREDRVVNGFSGGVTLYIVHERFYDFVLQLPDSCHIDRELGNTAFKHKYLVCNPYVVMQAAGYSENLRRSMAYDSYHDAMTFFK